MRKFFNTQGLGGIIVLLITFTLFRSEKLHAGSLHWFYKGTNPDLGQAQAFSQKPFDQSQWNVSHDVLLNEFRNNLLAYPICDANGNVPQWTESDIVWAGTDPLKSMTIYPKGSTMNAMWNSDTKQIEYGQVTLDGTVGIQVILCEYHFDANHQVVYDPKYYALFKKTAGTSANGHACINPQRAIFPAYVSVKTVTLPGEPYPVETVRVDSFPVPGETVYTEVPVDRYVEVPVDRPYPVYQETGGYAQASFSAGISFGYAPTMPQQCCPGGNNYYIDNSYNDNSYYNNVVTNNYPPPHHHHHEDHPPVDHPQDNGSYENPPNDDDGAGDYNGWEPSNDGNNDGNGDVAVGNNTGGPKDPKNGGGRNAASSNGLLASNAIRNNTTTPKVDVKGDTRSEVAPTRTETASIPSRAPKTFSASPKKTVNPQALEDTRGNNLTQGETQIRNFNGSIRKETVSLSNSKGPRMNANQKDASPVRNLKQKAERANYPAVQKQDRNNNQLKNQMNNGRKLQPLKQQIARNQQAPQKMSMKQQPRGGQKMSMKQMARR